MEPPTRIDIVTHILRHSQDSDMTAHYGIFEIRRDRIEIDKDALPAGCRVGGGKGMRTASGISAGGADDGAEWTSGNP
jgi:hypothetical protein